MRETSCELGGGFRWLFPTHRSRSSLHWFSSGTRMSARAVTCPCLAALVSKGAGLRGARAIGASLGLSRAIEARSRRSILYTRRKGESRGRSGPPPQEGAPADPATTKPLGHSRRTSPFARGAHPHPVRCCTGRRAHRRRPYWPRSASSTSPELAGRRFSARPRMRRCWGGRDGEVRPQTMASCQAQSGQCMDAD